MRDRTQWEVWKVVIYGVAFMWLGAVISPWIYNACMALAEVTSVKRTNGFLDRLGAVFRQTEFPRFFEWGMIAAAVLLYFPLVEWLRIGRGEVKFRDSPWSLVVMDETVELGTGQPLRRNPDWWLDFGKGFFMMASGMVLIALALLVTGTFVVKEGVRPFSELPVGLLVLALGVAFAREWAFRGVMLGVFLRAMRPMRAVMAMSLLFALIHSLRPPPDVVVADPEATRVGFEVLGKLVGRLGNPLVVLTEFAPLLVLGGMFAHARCRTASLWLSFGLHASWIFMSGLLDRWMVPVPQTETLVRAFVGDSVHRGLIPLAGFMFVWLLVYFLTPPDVVAPAESS